MAVGLDGHQHLSGIHLEAAQHTDMPFHCMVAHLLKQLTAAGQMKRRQLPQQGHWKFQDVLQAALSKPAGLTYNMQSVQAFALTLRFIVELSFCSMHAHNQIQFRCDKAEAISLVTADSSILGFDAGPESHQKEM